MSELAGLDSGEAQELLGLRARVRELEQRLEEHPAGGAAGDVAAAHRLAEQHRLLFERSPLGKLVFDVETYRFLEVNDAALDIYGYTRAELLGMRLTDIKLPEDVSKLRTANQDGRNNVGVVKHRRKDGRIVEVAIVSQHMLFDGKRARLAAVRDVTEERKLEEQLRQSQKMDAIGRLAGGVAHDFNNILAIILTDAELAMAIMGEGHPAYGDVKEIQAAGRRAAGLTRQLLTFSRQQPCCNEVLELNTVISGLERMLSRIIGEDIRVSTSLFGELGSVKADRGQLEQILLNLVVNARDAMPNGGTLTIETSNVDLCTAAADEVGIPARQYVRLQVTDTGVGMDAATVARVFEPFFTTKDVGKGTGLGLATIFGIVKQSGGGIAVDSMLGSGTTFTVYLPRVEATSIAAVAPPATMPRGSETVLVVEDDEQVRRVVCRLLRSKGHVVLEARSGAAALELLADGAQGVDLIVTDVVMPDLDGRTMAAMVLERSPHAKVLYMSGYTEHPAIRGVGHRPMEHFIRKPFTIQEMTVAVRCAIQGVRRTPSGEMAAAGSRATRPPTAGAPVTRETLAF